MKKTLLLTVAIFFAFGLSGCSYNDLTAKQQKVKSQWSEVENQMQRRADLINNLAESAKLAGVQEQEVFGKIAEARSKLLNTAQQAPQGADGDKSPAQKKEIVEADNTLGGALSRLLVLQEAYPNLKSNENFLQLQNSVEGTENRIAVARNDYKTVVENYNTTRNQFPAVLTASLMGFPEEPYFQAAEGAKEVPKIDSNSLRENK